MDFSVMRERERAHAGELRAADRTRFHPRPERSSHEFDPTGFEAVVWRMLWMCTEQIFFCFFCWGATICLVQNECVPKAHARMYLRNTRLLNENDFWWRLTAQDRK